MVRKRLGWVVRGLDANSFKINLKGIIGRCEVKGWMWKNANQNII
jgi:hypothetical protein